MIKALTFFVLALISLHNFAQDSTRSNSHIIGLDLTTTPSFSQDDFRKLNLIASDEVVVDKREIQFGGGVGYTYYKWFKHPLAPYIGFHAGITRLLRFREYSVSPVLRPFTPCEFSGNIFIGGIAFRASWMLKKTPIIDLGKTGLSFNIHGNANLDKLFGSPTQLNETSLIPYAQIGTSLVIMGKEKTTGEWRSYPSQQISFDVGFSKLSITTFRIFTIIPITEW